MNRFYDTMPEEWRPVVGYEGRYSVSDLGRVWTHPKRRPTRFPGVYSVLPAKLLKPTLRAGYWIVTLSGRHFGIATLVAAAFIGPKPAGQEVRHLDGDRVNNVPGNLSYGTSRENCADRERHGKTVRGERAPKAKLTEAIVREARAAQMTTRQVVEAYGVNRHSARAMLVGESWRHVQ